MKILVIKPSSFGDIVQSNPVLTALKKNYQGCAVKWLVFDEWRSVLELFPGLDGVIVWEKKAVISGYSRALKEIRKEKFDIVIDLQGLARSAVIARFSGADRIIGVPGMKELSGLLVKEPYRGSRGMNAARRSLESVRYLSGVAYEPEFKLSVPETAVKEAGTLIPEGNKIIGLVPSARGVSKQWPAGHFEKLTGLVLGDYPDCRIAVFGGPDDKWNMRDPRVINLCGKTSIPSLAACLKKCAVVIGGDTGPVHLAAALDVPVIALFGGSDVKETAPVNARATVLTKNLPCSPCRTRPSCKDFRCMVSITTEEVFEAAKKWLKPQ